ITPDSNTSDQEQSIPSSIFIQDQSNGDRTTIETEQSSGTNQQVVVISDMEGSDRTINLERSDAETDSNSNDQQIQSDTELKDGSTDKNNLMNVNRVINSVAVILTSPQSIVGLLGVGVSIIFIILRTVKLTILRGEKNMIIIKNLFNKPVKGVTVRILDKEFQSDENGMVVTDLPVDNVGVKGLWIVIKSN
ncbi:MAG: hypothetical protein QW336_03090, partial [Candidatus Anstonellales archaeon]